MAKTPHFNHRQVLQLALPMIVSNISTPLLGLVDTAVMGHLDSSRFLAGVALGGLIFTFIYWGFGFLRMGTTGVTAQACGNSDQDESKSILLRALLISLVISLFILLCQYPIRRVSFWVIESSTGVEQLAATYFNIRIWSTPATLSNYVLLGWFIGTQDVKSPLCIVVTTNLLNMILDIQFVVFMDLEMSGVALASVLAEYAGFLLGMLILRRKLKYYHGGWNWQQVFNIEKFKKLLIINNNIFLRTLCLIFAFAFFTVQGAKFGEIILAANTILLNFLMFTAFALDGIAYAAEALVGRAIGAGNTKLFKQTVATTAFWSSINAFGFSIVYAVFGPLIINLLTDLVAVRVTAYQYLPWVVVLPITSFTCYLLDGIFIGATLSREMRNTMFLSTLCFYLPAWYFTRFLQNHGLWAALIVFMLTRSLSMALVFKTRKHAWLGKKS